MTISNAESIAARQVADSAERVLETVNDLLALLAPVERAATDAELDAADLALIARCPGCRHAIFQHAEVGCLGKGFGLGGWCECVNTRAELESQRCACGHPRARHDLAEAEDITPECGHPGCECEGWHQ